MSNSLNRFLHGTLWKWIPNELALIISNDEYNSQNPYVNCVSVTGVTDDSISIDNIQCSQIHTVEKEALHEFRGAVPAPILAAVKTKIQKQFNIGDDKAIHAIQETAARLFGQLAQMDTEHVSPSVSKPTEDTPVTPVPTLPLSNKKADITTEVSAVVVDSDVILPEPPKDNIKPPVDNKPSTPARKQRGEKSQKTAEISPQTGKPKREMRNYTDEDEAFVLDGNPTAKEIMDRFGFTEKRKVHDLKFLLKKRRNKRESK